MRALSLSDGFDMKNLAKAVAAEIEDHARQHGEVRGAVLVLSVKSCSDSMEESGAVPPRETQPR
jgi:hypothetical protein